MGGDASNGLVQIELLLMDHVLSDRRIVITSDYEGPLSGFGNGPLAATGEDMNLIRLSKKRSKDAQRAKGQTELTARHTLQQVF